MEIVKKTKSRKMRMIKYVIYKETLINKEDLFWSFLGSFLAIGIIGYLSNLLFPLTDTIFLIGSLGASAVLVFGDANSPLAQPRNFLGGHILSALVGVSIQQLFPSLDMLWLACGLSVSLALIVMQITKTVHPPGGATALIAIIGSEKIKKLAYLYVISPVLSGVLIMLILALIVNNIPDKRKYPYKGKWF